MTVLFLLLLCVIGLPVQPLLCAENDLHHVRVVQFINSNPILEGTVQKRIRLLEILIGIKEDASNADTIYDLALQDIQDEILQKEACQEILKQITPAMLDNYIDQFARNIGKTTEDLQGFFEEKGISWSLFKENRLIKMAWQEYVKLRYKRDITVSATEISNRLKTLERYQGQTAYRLAEIVFYASTENKNKALLKAQQVLSLLKQQVPFQSLTQLSQAPSRHQGGYVGWRYAEQLEKKQRQALEAIQPGMVTTPVLLSHGGYGLFVLIGKEKIAPPTRQAMEAMISQERLAAVEKAAILNLRNKALIENANPSI